MYISYHDKEWGRPVYDDLLLFEFLILEGMQAGLSWITVLRKRENFRKAFDGFAPEIIAKYSDEDIDRLLNDAGIIRNRLKVMATISNAKAYLAVKKEFGSFSSYIWQFTKGKSIINAWTDIKAVHVSTPEAEAMSKDLKKRGFKFVGPTICYAFMQAVGMVNDHLVSCFVYDELK